MEWSLVQRPSQTTSRNMQRPFWIITKLLTEGFKFSITKKDPKNPISRYMLSSTERRISNGKRKSAHSKWPDTVRLYNKKSWNKMIHKVYKLNLQHLDQAIKNLKSVCSLTKEALLRSHDWFFFSELLLNFSTQKFHLHTTDALPTDLFYIQQ